MTLNDQLTISASSADFVASRSDILHTTIVSGRIGWNGDERHAVRVTIWAPNDRRPVAGIGSVRVDCGAQRASSSVHSLSTTAPITCERCIRVGGTIPTESLPTDVLVEVDRGLVPA